MPSLNMRVQRLNVAILPLDLPCCGPVTNSEGILITGKSHGKNSDRFSLTEDTAGYTRTDYKTNTQIANKFKIAPILDK